MMDFTYNDETDTFESDFADFTVQQTHAMPRGEYVFFINYKNLRMGFFAKRTYRTVSEGNREKKNQASI